MKQFSFSLLLVSIVSVMSVVGCGPDPLYPDEPILSFKTYNYNGSDSLTTVFSFTDGDGDIGVDPSGNDYNMLLTLYYKDQNGDYQAALFPASPDTIKYPYRIPQLPDGQNGLEGDIHLVVNTTMITYDTIRFNAFLVDQTNHRSAVIQTPELGLR